MIRLNDKHIHLKVPAGETALIQITEDRSNRAFYLDGGTLILGETSGGGNLIIDGGKTSGITSGYSLIYATASDSYAQGSYVEINSGVTLRNNNSGSNEGAAVDVGGVSGRESAIKISGGTISGNTTTGPGGAISVRNYSNLAMTGGIIENNHAGTNGGGISSWNGGDQSIAASWPVISISGGEIRYNEASGDGGGIRSFGTTAISGTAKIHHNRAGGSGGGIFKNDTVNANNTLTFAGGNSATYVYDNSAPTDAQVSNP
jgi:hypothetical protein